MSYSYIKTVFPDFNYSSVYDSKLYDNVNVSKHDLRLFEPANSETGPVYSSISNVKQEEPIKAVKSLETFQDNQRFYNLPLPEHNIPISNNRVNNIETLDNNNKAHMEYTKHVLECPSCKELLMKQFGLENERIRNEEIMELISYLIFGLFILLLIDTYTKK